MKFPNIEDIKKWNFVTKINDMTRSNVFMNTLAKSLVIIIVWIGALIPTWFYLLLRWAVSPETTMQELILLGIVILPLGSSQLILAIMAFMTSVAVIIDDSV